MLNLQGDEGENFHGRTYMFDAKDMEACKNQFGIRVLKCKNKNNKGIENKNGLKEEVWKNMPLWEKNSKDKCKRIHHLRKLLKIRTKTREEKHSNSHKFSQEISFTSTCHMFYEERALLYIEWNSSKRRSDPIKS